MNIEDEIRLIIEELKGKSNLTNLTGEEPKDSEKITQKDVKKPAENLAQKPVQNSSEENFEKSTDINFKENDPKNSAFIGGSLDDEFKMDENFELENLSEELNQNFAKDENFSKKADENFSSEAKISQPEILKSGENLTKKDTKSQSEESFWVSSKDEDFHHLSSLKANEYQKEIDELKLENSKLNLALKAQKEAKIEFLNSLKDRILVLFQGLSSFDRGDIEARVELNLKFMEFLLATTEKELKNLSK